MFDDDGVAAGGEDPAAGQRAGGAGPSGAGGLGWHRLGRERPAPVIVDSLSGEPEPVERAQRVWRNMCRYPQPGPPEPASDDVVPDLPEEMLAMLGWREVPAPGPDASEDEIQEWLGPEASEDQAEEIGAYFDFLDETLEAPGTLEGPVSPGPHMSAERLWSADPDPRPRGWALAPARERLPVGHAPLLGGGVADVGAHARRRADEASVYELLRLDEEATDAYTLVEAIAAWERVEAMAAHKKRMLAHELAMRPQLSSLPPADAATAQATQPVAAAEIAFRLGTTRQGARALIEAGTAMTRGIGMLAGAALEAGQINAAKADLLIERTNHLPAELALAVQEAVLQRAPLRTLPQLRRDIEEQLARIDPQDFSARHARARTKRRIEAPQVLPDGMACTRIIWSAIDAIAMQTMVEAAARSAKQGGDARSMDQLRTDALATLVHTALATGRIGPCHDTCAGTSPTHPDRTDTEAATDETATDEARTGLAGADPADKPGPILTPFALGAVGGAKAQIRITVPLSTLMGTDSQPADLEGYGPIPAEVAKAWAAGGIWKRLVTDPRTKRAMQVTANQYTPPPWLREQVIINNPYCVAPGCNTQARHSDLDHTVPFPHGPTIEWNLHPVCRAHHRLKTHAGFSYQSPGPGVHEWTTPTGHRYRTDHTGTRLLPPSKAHALAHDPPPF